MTLQKKILRGLRKNLSFYLTGSLLTALCIMLWVGAFSVSRTASGAYTRLFEESDLEDGQFTVSSPISDQDITALESEFNVILERQRFRNISLRRNDCPAVRRRAENEQGGHSGGQAAQRGQLCSPDVQLRKGSGTVGRRLHNACRN